MSAPAILLDRVSAGYGKRMVLEGFSLRVGTGQLAALAGPNGSGKTTALKLILGILSPRAGCVEVAGLAFGTDRAGKKRAAEARRRIGYLPQLHAAPALPVSALEMTLLGRWGMHYSWLKGPGAEDRRLALEALGLVGMEAYADRQYAELSGGQRQRVALARALARQPELLVMDEPTTWLDKEAKEDLMARVFDLHRRLGMTALVVTHEDLSGASFDSVTRLGEARP